MMKPADFLVRLQALMASPADAVPLVAEDLTLDLWGVQPAELDWLLDYLGPLARPGAGAAGPRWRVGTRFDAALVSAGIALVESGGVDHLPVWNGRSQVQRLFLADGWVVDVDPRYGALYVHEPAARRLLLVTSLHVGHPLHELARLLRGLITDHLRARGWSLFHAGAVRVGGRDCLVIGDAGAGKTSLILALLHGGAQFIANDRIFLRPGPDGLAWRPFPMAVAVGLGTALQYPALEYLLHHPQRLRYPRRRLDVDRLAATPVRDWPRLPDKLQLFPGELVSLFGGGPLPEQGTIDAVLLPRLGLVQGLALQAMAPAQAGAVIARNHLPAASDPVHPAWLPGAAPGDEEGAGRRVCEALGALPLVDCHFTAGRHLLNAMRDWPAGLGRWLEDEAAVA